MPADYRPTIWLMRGCGLRIGEALGVRSGDFHDGILRLSRQMLADGTYGPLKHRGPDDFRDVPVPGYVEPVSFAPIWRQTYTNAFNHARDVAGLPKSFTPHSLRHVYASVALANGIPISDVSQFLGHASIQTTFAIYGHLVPSSFDSARKVLDSEYAEWRGMNGQRSHDFMITR